MKQYVIDELRPGEYDKIKEKLDELYGPPKLDGIYWIPLEANLLNNVQAEHIDCKPHYFAVDLKENFVSCELLIRTQQRIKCNCIEYANEKQRNAIIKIIDSIFEELGIII